MTEINKSAIFPDTLTSTIKKMKLKTILVAFNDDDDDDDADH